jgi:hypothetical protein
MIPDATQARHQRVKSDKVASSVAMFSIRQMSAEILFQYANQAARYPLCSFHLPSSLEKKR